MKKAVIVFIVLAAIIVVLLIIGKKNFSTEIIINAPAGKIWKEFSNFSAYPGWNPFIKKLTGDIKKGAAIRVTIQPKNGKPMVFNPVITELIGNQILQWEGTLFIPGIFTGKHTFQLESVDTNKTKFIQKEEFNGILVPFVDLTPTLEGFKSMNALLKERVEKGR